MRQTQRLEAGGRKFIISGDAANPNAERGIDVDILVDVLGGVCPFRHHHQGEWKDGYYDNNSGLFIAVVDDTIATVITRVTLRYVENLISGGP